GRLPRAATGSTSGSRFTLPIGSLASDPPKAGGRKARRPHSRLLAEAGGREGRPPRHDLWGGRKTETTGEGRASKGRETRNAAWRRHWPEYLMEAGELALFMISACLFVVLLEHPASPVHRAIPSQMLRRVLMGLAMGSTAVAIIFSPLGKRS